MMSITRKVASLFSKKDRSPEAIALEAEIKLAIRTLEGYSDRELNDMGIARCNIKHAVRYGTAVNEKDFDQTTAA